MKAILLLCILFLLGACTSVNGNRGSPESELAARNLADYAVSLTGIRYKFGGNSPENGFDCSGFVGHVFRHALAIDLPRSSEEMSRLGRTVSMGNLRIGDLVFFNTSHRKFSHVGIYLGDDRFIHAPSTSTGSVRTENIREAYWKNHYNGARRIT